MAEANEKTPPTVEVVLVQPHVHGGQSCNKGDKIRVTGAQASWLRNRGVAASVSTSSEKTA